MNQNTSPGKEKREIRMVFLIFSVLFAIFAWKYYPSLLSYVLIILTPFILFLVIFSPLTLRPAFQLWLKITYAIGKFNTQVLLSLLFILIFIPAGIAMRLLGKDPMKRGRQSEKTYWEPCESEEIRDKNRYKQQF